MNTLDSSLPPKIKIANKCRYTDCSHEKGKIEDIICSFFLLFLLLRTNSIEKRSTCCLSQPNLNNKNKSPSNWSQNHSDSSVPSPTRKSYLFSTVAPLFIPLSNPEKNLLSQKSNNIGLWNHKNCICRNWGPSANGTITQIFMKKCNIA